MPSYTSKELSEWLHAHGCNVGTEYFWTNVVLGFVDMDFNRPVFDEKSFVVKHESEIHTACPVAIPAHSWYDILVTHAKEFFGEVEEGPLDYNPIDMTPQILTNLQHENFQDAEMIVRKYSLFSRQAKND